MTPLAAYRPLAHCSTTPYGDWADGFAVGDGARVLLYAPDFVSANLHTYDGTTFFSVGVTLARVKFALGTPALIGSDEFDSFP
jgi:hypothetical protein